MDEKLKDNDVLLVREKGSSELQTAGMDKKGKVQTAKPDENNPDFIYFVNRTPPCTAEKASFLCTCFVRRFLKINKNGNVPENFFEKEYYLLRPCAAVHSE